MMFLTRNELLAQLTGTVFENPTVYSSLNIFSLKGWKERPTIELTKLRLKITLQNTTQGTFSAARPGLLGVIEQGECYSCLHYKGYPNNNSFPHTFKRHFRNMPNDYGDSFKKLIKIKK
jgi:hypothetical protein